MMEISVRGTFAGHVLPGAMLIFLALYWSVQHLGRVAGGRALRPLETGLVVPLAKVSLAAVGVVTEMPHPAWNPAGEAVMMNWQHITMYSGFGLSGVIDLLARRGVVSAQATYVAWAAATLNGAFLFWGHPNHGGVPGTVHFLLILLFAAVAFATIVESVRPSPGWTRLRIGSTLAVGSWFVIAAWILYRSGWDMGSEPRVGWTYTIFAWNAFLSGTLATALGVAHRLRQREPALS